MSLYRIDLSRMVSRYIGEAEKNLDEAFTRRLRFATTGQGILRAKP